MSKVFNIAIIDDRLPRTAEGFYNIVDYEIIDEAYIKNTLRDNVKWDDLSLKSLVQMLFESPYLKEGRISVKWAYHPSFCLNAVIKNNYAPDLIIFDWEYDVSQNLETVIANLKELADRTTGLIFIYSNLAQRVPVELFKNHLDKYSNKLQVLKKGGEDFIFSSEEFIYQYIANILDDNPKVPVHGIEIQFDKSGKLENTKDILYLESIIGKSNLLKKLELINNNFNDQSVVAILDSMNQSVYATENNEYFFNEPPQTIEEKYGAIHQTSLSSAFKVLGLKKLMELLERGVAKA